MVFEDALTPACSSELFVKMGSIRRLLDMVEAFGMARSRSIGYTPFKEDIRHETN